MKNDVWEIVPRPERKYFMTLKWIYKVYQAAYGTIEKHMAKFVAHGLSQNEGIDYEDTFSPIARYTPIKPIISLAPIMKLTVHQMDVKTTFLNGVVEEEV